MSEPMTVATLIEALEKVVEKSRKVLIQVGDDGNFHSHLYLYSVREEEIGIDDEGKYDEDSCNWTPQPVVLLEYE